MIALGMLNGKPTIPINKREKEFQKYMYKYWQRSIASTTLIDLWRRYVTLPKEDCQMYECLKEEVSTHLGIRVHEDILNYTRFYHQTQYMVKKGTDDIISDKYICFLT